MEVLVPGMQTDSTVSKTHTNFLYKQKNNKSCERKTYIKKINMRRWKAGQRNQIGIKKKREVLWTEADEQAKSNWAKWDEAQVWMGVAEPGGKDGLG